MSDFANAWPTKRFFLEMLVRDIALEDAILDLVDNSIDSLARTRRIPLSEALLDTKIVAKHSARLKSEGLPKIDIQLSQTKFSITDNCGGITYDAAKNNVFRFGRVTEGGKSRLSVYGIGLKRAIFKIGRAIEIRSRTKNDGFVVKIDTDDWGESDAQDGANPLDWRFPITETTGVSSASSAGTEIQITRLNDNIKLRIADGQIDARLHEVLSSAYALILDHFVTLQINGERVRPQQIPLGLSPKVTPGKDKFDVPGASVTVIAGLAERTERKEWKIERAGWYVLCNGRVVVFADKSDLTGWGLAAPQFVPKFRGFVGIAFFFSEDPESLPWTTTKRGLNRDSPAYHLARNKMAVLARPVLNFLNNMYAGDIEGEEPEERGIADTMRPANIADVLKSSGRSFSVTKPVGPPKSKFVSIQYKAKPEDVERIKNAVSKPSWSNSRVGQHTFEYFLEKECTK